MNHRLLLRLPSRDLLGQLLDDAALAGLEQCLIRGDRMDESTAIPIDPDDLAMGAVSRELEQQDAGTYHWARLTPISLVADVASVGLVGIPELSNDEAAELHQIIETAFCDTPWTAMIDAGGGFWLRSESSLELETCSPESVLGLDIHDYLPSGSGAGRWRSISGEIEIELHHAAFNLRRASNGDTPVNGLWIWGNGTLPNRSSTEPFCQYSDDRWQGLSARWHGGLSRPLMPPESLATETDDQRSSIRIVALDRCLDGALITQWIDALPGLVRLRPELCLGRSAPVRIAAWHRLRFWRQGS